MARCSYKQVTMNILLDDFIQYYINENHSFYETLEHFDFKSDYFLQEYIKRNGVSKKDNNCTNLLSKTTKEDVYIYYILENHSIAESAKYFNCSESTFKHLIREYNIKKEQKDVIKISNKTKLERYDDIFNIKKSKQTKLERYGDENYNNREKQLNTINEKYGSKENFYKLRQEKLKDTNIKKYGVDCVFKASAIQEKIKNYNINTYGTEYYTQSDDFKIKSRQTCLDKYGVDNYSKTELSKQQQNKLYHDKINNGLPICDYSKHGLRYTYDSLNFDSSWELALYIYLKDNNIKFEYQPDIKLEYEYDNLKHWYFPDFKINNKLYEIKSDYLLRCMSDKQFSHFSPKENKKYDLMLLNNITILTKENMIPYLEYIHAKYGKNYLQTFRNKKEINIDGNI